MTIYSKPLYTISYLNVQSDVVHYLPSGLPTLPRGIVAIIYTVSNDSIEAFILCCMYTFANTSLGTLSVIGVSIRPGKIVLHLMPCLLGHTMVDNNLLICGETNVSYLASSRENVFVSEITPPLDAV